MKRWLPVALALALGACDTTVTKEEMATADYGPAPVNYQDEIKSYLSLRLTDPKTAIVEFRNQPKQLYQRGTAVRGEQFGWGVCVWVNDKNKQGAYDGFYPMSFVLRNEKIVAVNGGPDDFNIIGAKYAREQCARLGAPFNQ
ncbi:MAG TPA: hypothetical protein VE756_07145 [Burkholderiales bacterium]|jgi:hypothetical protein|nr:hypothetical protein [Burkholderiales bacterium]